MAGAIRTGDREEPMSSEASSSVTSMREARRSPARRTAATSGPALSTFIASWQLALEAAAKSSRTVRYYTELRPGVLPVPRGPGHARFRGRRGRPHVGCVRSGPLPQHPRVLRLARQRGQRENPNPMDRVEAPKVTKKAKE